jgi:hypothetical protein
MHNVFDDDNHDNYDAKDVKIYSNPLKRFNLAFNDL